MPDGGAFAIVRTTRRTSRPARPDGDAGGGDLRLRLRAGVPAGQTEKVRVYVSVLPLDKRRKMG